jgi:hypothetical protein
VPFGFNLDVKEMDEFLVEKICKKLKYWSTLQLPLSIRAMVVNYVLAMVVNYVLAFTPWFLMNVSRNTKINEYM